MGALFEAIINISISLILVNIIGLNGVMFGTLVANTFRTIQYAFFISNHVIKGSIRKTIIIFCWFLSNSILIIGLQLFTFRFLPEINTWSVWMIYGVVALFIATIVTLASSYIFYKPELKRVIRIPLALINEKGGKSND